MPRIEQRIAELGLHVPAGNPPSPEKPFLPWVLDGPMLYVSGQLPDIDGEPPFRGQLGGEVSVDDGRRAANAVARNLVAAIRLALSDLDRVERIVKLLAFVNSAPGFTEQPAVVNGASEVFVDLWGDDGLHGRSAIGVSALPRGVPIEIEAIVRVSP